MAARHNQLDPTQTGKAFVPPQFSMPESVDELPILTPQQFAYVGCRIQGMRIVEAYRECYDVSTMLNTTIWARASEVEHNRNVSAWIEAAREQALVDTRTTREQHSARLAYLSRQAEKAGKYSAAIAGEYYRGRVEGHYHEKPMEGGEIPDVDKVLKLIEYLLGADQAMLAAAKLGVEYKPNRKKLEQSEG